MSMLPVRLDGITAEGEEARFVTGSTASLIVGSLTLTAAGVRCQLCSRPAGAQRLRSRR